MATVISTFEDAVKTAKSIPKTTPNSQKAKIYGMYKCATVGPFPPGSRPSMINFEGRSKWDAWKSAGSTDGMTKESAREAYRKLIAGMVVGVRGSAFTPIGKFKQTSSAVGAATPSPKPQFPSPLKAAAEVAVTATAGNLDLAMLQSRIRNALLKIESSAEGKLGEVKDALEKVQVELESKTSDARARLNSVGSRVGFSFGFFTIAYLSRLFVSIAFLVSTGYLNALSSNLAGYRNPQIKITGPSWAKGTTTLPDIGHDIIGRFTREYLGTDYIDWFELPDHFVSFMGTSCVIFVLLHPRRFMILRRLCIIFGLLNLLRSFTVIVTSLPDASPECAKQFTKKGQGSYKDQTLEVALATSLRRAFLLIINPSNHITCGDMVFSGHTCFLTLTTLVFVEYCRSYKDKHEVPCRALRWFMRLTWAVGVVAIVGTKLHYTLDVFLAALLTVTTWRAFHHAVEFDMLKNHYRVLRWIEEESILEVDERAYREFVKKNKLD